MPDESRSKDGQPRLGRPRVYGDDSKCRSAISRYIGRGEELLDQLAGFTNHIQSIEDDVFRGLMDEMVFDDEWGRPVRRWTWTARRGLRPFLQEQVDELLPILVSGPPVDTGKHGRPLRRDEAGPWLQAALKELRSLQGTLGVKRDVAKQAPLPVRFVELRESSLVDGKMVADHETAMARLGTPRQLADAIGSAKELVEATLRAALDTLGGQYSAKDDLPSLMKKWRQAVAKVAPPDESGRQVLDQVQAALANVVRFLGEWRNPYGRGHGRPRYPTGLRTRHARLAVDVAETSIRFIVTTMDDLSLLPPSGDA